MAAAGTVGAVGGVRPHQEPPRATLSRTNPVLHTLTLHVPACTPDTTVPTTLLRGLWLSLALTGRCRPGTWDLGWGPSQWSSPHWLCIAPSGPGCLWVGALEIFVGHGGSPGPRRRPRRLGLAQMPLGPDATNEQNRQRPLGIGWRGRLTM